MPRVLENPYAAPGQQSVGGAIASAGNDFVNTIFGPAGAQADAMRAHRRYYDAEAAKLGQTTQGISDLAAARAAGVTNPADLLAAAIRAGKSGEDLGNEDVYLNSHNPGISIDNPQFTKSMLAAGKGIGATPTGQNRELAERLTAERENVAERLQAEREAIAQRAAAAHEATTRAAETQLAIDARTLTQVQDPATGKITYVQKSQAPGQGVPDTVDSLKARLLRGYLPTDDGGAPKVTPVAPAPVVPPPAPVAPPAPARSDDPYAPAVAPAPPVAAPAAAPAAAPPAAAPAPAALDDAPPIVRSVLGLGAPEEMVNPDGRSGVLTPNGMVKLTSGEIVPAAGFAKGAALPAAKAAALRAQVAATPGIDISDAANHGVARDSYTATGPVADVGAVTNHLLGGAPVVSSLARLAGLSGEFDPTAIGAGKEGGAVRTRARLNNFEKQAITSSEAFGAARPSKYIETQVGETVPSYSYYNNPTSEQNDAIAYLKVLKQREAALRDAIADPSVPEDQLLKLHDAFVKNQDLLKAAMTDDAGAPGAASAAKAATPAPATSKGGPVQVSSPDEAATLKPGTHYLTPDGKEFVR
jgi:hypothetical protein